MSENSKGSKKYPFVKTSMSYLRYLGPCFKLVVKTRVFQGLNSKKSVSRLDLLGFFVHFLLMYFLGV